MSCGSGGFVYTPISSDDDIERHGIIEALLGPHQHLRCDIDLSEQRTVVGNVGLDGCRARVSEWFLYGDRWHDVLATHCSLPSVINT